MIGGFVSPVHDLYGKKVGVNGVGSFFQKRMPLALQDLAPSQHRVQMCNLAFGSSDWITVDTWECMQSSWIRTRVVHQRLERKLEEELGRSSISYFPPKKSQHEPLQRSM